MGTTLGTEYTLYTYMDPLGNAREGVAIILQLSAATSSFIEILSLRPLKGGGLLLMGLH